MGSARILSERQQLSHVNKAGHDPSVGVPFPRPESSPSGVPDAREILGGVKRVCPENHSRCSQLPYKMEVTIHVFTIAQIACPTIIGQDRDSQIKGFSPWSALRQPNHASVAFTKCVSILVPMLGLRPLLVRKRDQNVLGLHPSLCQAKPCTNIMTMIG